MRSAGVEHVDRGPENMCAEGPGVERKTYLLHRKQPAFCPGDRRWPRGRPLLLKDVRGPGSSLVRGETTVGGYFTESAEDKNVSEESARRAGESIKHAGRAGPAAFFLACQPSPGSQDRG